MSANLDRSLDEILAQRPRGGRRGNKTSAPAGGIRKRPQRAAAQKATASVTPNATKAAASSKNNAKSTTTAKINAQKIIVSNLPYDVSEGMIKEYFSTVVGPIKRATVTYGPDGRSRGVATVEFTKPEHAAVAAQKFNGVEVDKRPMKVELVVDPTAPASFAERVGKPNPVETQKPKIDKPKPATKSTRGRGNARGGRRGRGGAASGRSKPKTAEQLDQEMADYWGDNNQQTNNPATTDTAANGDVGMTDEVL